MDFHGEPGWLHRHPHEPNLIPPEGDGAFTVAALTGEQYWTVAELSRLPYTSIADCYIVSTGHGVSGPFVFGGVLAADFLAALDIAPGWLYLDVISADGFGARLVPADLSALRPPLLAYEIDGKPMTRSQGLTRLIVPAETDDALRQVKWIAQIHIVEA